MAAVHQRVFATVLAVLFLVTSSSIAILFIVSSIQSHNSSSSNKQSSTGSYANDVQGQKLPGFTPVASVTQEKTTDLVEGTGATVKSSSTISVGYVGAVAATGIIFQASSSPVSLSLSNVIIGWRIGIPGMKVGGTRQLLIPAALAYGKNPPSGSGIPANAALVFDVTVKSLSGS